MHVDVNARVRAARLEPHDAREIEGDALQKGDELTRLSTQPRLAPHWCEPPRHARHLVRADRHDQSIWEATVPRAVDEKVVAHVIVPVEQHFDAAALPSVVAGNSAAEANMVTVCARSRD